MGIDNKGVKIQNRKKLIGLSEKIGININQITIVELRRYSEYEMRLP
ncbi:hypothetical protein GCM10023210_27030 [Chryseobacterium ginsengisoli]|uniref:Uncharacterized protein n=1 Tax=Chryseobacterium ginsengisoli TaxID=363853 RepID=A0ABP9MGR6_9FLAO